MRNAGTLTKEKDGFKVVFDRELNHHIETVWDAITNPQKLKTWFTDFEMEFKEGKKIRILFRDEAKTVTTGEIITIEPPTKFAWTWEGELAVWELKAEGKNKCHLRLTYSKLADQYAVGATAGFDTVLQRLELFLNGRTEPYPFGTEENDPEQIALREKYGEMIFEKFPELTVHSPVKMEKIFNVPASKVWDALTKREETKKWYFDFPENFKPVVGQEFDWYATSPDCVQWLHRGKITEVVQGKKLAHTWEYPGYPGKGKVTWNLTELEPNRTKLNLLYEILIPFDPKEEALKRKNFVAGWNEIVGKNLRDYLKS